MHREVRTPRRVNLGRLDGMIVVLGSLARLVACAAVVIGAFIFGRGLDVANITDQRDPIVLMLVGIGVMQIGLVGLVIAVIRRQR